GPGRRRVHPADGPGFELHHRAGSRTGARRARTDCPRGRQPGGAGHRTAGSPPLPERGESGGRHAVIRLEGGAPPADRRVAGRVPATPWLDQAGSTDGEAGPEDSGAGRTDTLEFPAGRGHLNPSFTGNTLSCSDVTPILPRPR